MSDTPSTVEGDNTMAGKGRPGPECQVSRLLDGLPANEAEVLRMVLADRDEDGDWLDPAALVASAATELAQRNGLDERVHKETVKHHRRKECRCE